jgi:hypothetical protein
MDHCGGCFKSCIPYDYKPGVTGLWTSCLKGVCDPGPPSTDTHDAIADCGDYWGFIELDPDNCGACGNACPAGKRRCVYADCMYRSGGTEDCLDACGPCDEPPGLWEGYIECDGICLEPTTIENCGSCGNKCGPGQACIGRECVSS